MAYCLLYELKYFDRQSLDTTIAILSDEPRDEVKFIPESFESSNKINQEYKLPEDVFDAL